MIIFLTDIQVSETLLDNVQGTDLNGGNSLDLIKQAIRKFFQRSDPDGRGLVSEERFRAFLRYF